jgi:uncharacterized protein with FMN-binding domain
MVPRRALTALVTTALGLVLLFSFRTPDEASPLDAAAASGVGIAGRGQGGGIVLPGSGSGGAVGGGGTSGGAASPGLPGVGPADGGSPGSGGTGGQPSGTGGVYTGPAVGTPFGAVQVQVAIADGILQDVTAIQLPSGDRHSLRLSQRAEPILRESALQAQSAQVDVVTGATYTSLAYARSLQAALDLAARA